MPASVLMWEKGLVKLVTCSDLSGWWMDMWRSGTFLEKPSLGECTTDGNHRPWSNSVVLVTLCRFRKLFHSCTEGTCHSYIRPTSCYVTEQDKSYRAFPILIFQVTNARNPVWISFSTVAHSVTCTFVKLNVNENVTNSSFCDLNIVKLNIW